MGLVTALETVNDVVEKACIGELSVKVTLKTDFTLYYSSVRTGAGEKVGVPGDTSEKVLERIVKEHEKTSTCTSLTSEFVSAVTAGPTASPAVSLATCLTSDSMISGARRTKVVCPGRSWGVRLRSVLGRMVPLLAGAMIPGCCCGE